MASKETKLGELIANSVEDHWFNPATLGYYLSQQPHWTVDRVMEVMMWVIEKAARRYEDESHNGQISEGLLLAYNLDKVIDKYRDKYEFKNLKFPPNKAEVQGMIDNIDPIKQESYKYSWLHENNYGQSAHINVQAVI